MDQTIEYELQEIADVQTGPFGSQLKNEQYITGGVPVITVEHIQDFRIVDFEYPSVTENDFLRLKKYSVKAGDIVFTRVGSVDLSAQVQPHQDGWLFSSRMLRVRPTTSLNAKYLAYYFQQPNFRTHILNISVGATMPSINTKILSEICIALPPISTQNDIANLIGLLDSQIRLLQQQNEVLDSEMECLYKQTVDRSSKNIVKLGDHVTCITGYSYSGKELRPSHEALITLKNFARGGGFRLDGFKEFVGRPKDSQIVEEGDLIVAHTDITQDAEIIGNPALVVGNQLHSKLVITMDLVKVVPNTATLPVLFLYFLMRSRDFKFHCLGCSNGTTVLHLSKAAIPSYEFSLPDAQALNGFARVTSPLLKKMFLNYRQISTTRNLKDFLLPRLISGQLQIRS